MLVAASQSELVERLKQFDFAAAVLDWYDGAAQAAAALQGKCVPFCIYSEAEGEGVPADITAPIVKTMDQVTETLVLLLE